jgi:hypothetical protein
MTQARLSPPVALKMAPLNSSERSRRHRERLAQGEQPQLGECLACGRKVQLRQQGARAGDAGLLCSACWRRSPAGKAADALRKRLARAKAKQQQQG